MLPGIHPLAQRLTIRCSNLSTVNTKAEIEQSIRNQLPIIFGEKDSVDRDAFLQKYNALVDYAAAVSAPFLGSETIRYQSMLLYVSLLFLAVRLFRIGQIKIGESPVPVDRNLLVIYALLIVDVSRSGCETAKFSFCRTRAVQGIQATRNKVRSRRHWI
jgi:hypothetical protein